jgi:hypothetical protein
MSKRMRVFGWSGYMVLVVAALGFGGVQLSGSSFDECLDLPPDFLGECVLDGEPGDQACNQLCQFYGGWMGVCYQDNPAPAPRCCICIL